MSVEIGRLIELVHAKPPLWDQKNKHYHNRHIVDRLWNETAAALNHKTIIVKKKWKSLRDQFRTELKKIPLELQSGLNADSCFPNMPPWPYFKSLIFIKEHMKTRKAPEQLQQSQLPLEEYSIMEKENDDDNNSIENNEKYCVQSGLDLFEVETLSTTQETQELTKHQEEIYTEPASTSKKRKRDQHTAKPNALLRGIDDDEDIAFFISLLPHVRKMDPARKMLCRMEIQNSVYNHAYRNSSRSLQDPNVRDESSQFSENILSTNDHMQFDTKEHVFFHHHQNNNR